MWWKTGTIIKFNLFIILVTLPLGTHSATDMTIPQSQSFTYLALGDSYTIGESVTAPERWCNQLTKLLNDKGIQVTDPDIIAQTGWTTSELANAIKDGGKAKKYSIVSLLVGVNNQYRGEPIEKFTREFQDLLATAVLFAGGKKDHVFVLSIPDWGVTPFAASSDRKKIASEIDAFNKVILEECAIVGIEFINVTPLSRAALNNSSMVASDGLHFSGKMYATWAALTFPVVKNILN